MTKGRVFQKAGVVLSLLVFVALGPLSAGVAFFSNTETAHAVVGELPLGIEEALRENKDFIIENIARMPGSNDALEDFKRTITGNDTGTDTELATWFMGVLLDGSLKTAPVQAWASGVRSTEANYADTYGHVYGSIYRHVSNLDEAWSSFLANDSQDLDNRPGTDCSVGINHLRDYKDDTFTLKQSPKISAFNDVLNCTLLLMDQRIMANLALVYGGLMLIKNMQGRPEVRADYDRLGIGGLVDFSQLTVLDFNKMAANLDNEQSTKHLYKRYNYVDALREEKHAGDDNETSVYGKLEDFYAQFRLFANILIKAKLAAGGTITTVPQITKIQEEIMQEAIAMDGRKGTNNVGDTSRCGRKPGGLEVGYAIAVAFCSIADIGQVWSVNMIDYSFDLLGQTANVAGADEANTFLPRELSGDLEGLFIESDNGLAQALRTIMRAMSILLNVVVVLFFLVIALLNMLQIQVSKFSINKLLPAIIMGFIAAQFSVYAVRASLEVVSQLSAYVLTVGIEGDATTNYTGPYKVVVSAIAGDTNAKLTTGNEPDITKVFGQFLRNIFVLIAAVMVLMLAFLFVIRSIVFFVLTPLSSIAFFSAFVPQLSTIWSKWSKTFMGWLFMPIVSSFWIWLGFQWLSAVDLSADRGQAILGIISFTALLMYVFGLLCIYLALKTPFSMAGEAKMVLDKWNGLGKKAWGSTGGSALKWSGKNIGDEAKAAVGLIPGVQKVRNWTDKNRKNGEARRKHWSEGRTMYGIRKARKKIEQDARTEADIHHEAVHLQEEVRKAIDGELGVERRAIEDKYREEVAKIQEEEQKKLKQLEADLATGVVKSAKDADDIRKKIIKEAADASENEKEESVKALAAMEKIQIGTDKDGKAIWKKREDIIKERFDKDSKKIEAKRVALANSRNSMKGLGYFGKQVMKLEAQKEHYQRAMDLKEADYGVAKAITQRILKGGTELGGRKYRSIFGTVQDSKMFAHDEVEYAQREWQQTYNEGKDVMVKHSLFHPLDWAPSFVEAPVLNDDGTPKMGADGKPVMKKVLNRDRNGKIISKYDVREGGINENRAGMRREKSTGGKTQEYLAKLGAEHLNFKGDLEAYRGGNKPIRLPGQSEASFNADLIQYEMGKENIKKKAREIASKQMDVADRFALEHKSHAEGIFTGTSIKEMWEKEKTNGDVFNEDDLANDRAKNAGQLAGMWKRFGQEGTGTGVPNYTLRAQQAKDLHFYSHKYGGGSPGAIAEQEILKRVMDACNVRDEAATKEALRDFHNLGAGHLGFVANIAERLSRDPYKAFTPGELEEFRGRKTADSGGHH